MNNLEMAFRKLLLIGADLTFLKNVQSSFDTIYSWDVSIAYSIKAILFQISTNPPDFIILDLEFLENVGLEILKTITKHMHCYSPVVVFISQHLTTEEESVLTTLGVSRIIYKYSLSSINLLL